MNSIFDVCMFALIVCVFAGVASIMHYGKKREDARWRQCGICPCGYREEAPFGDLFHIHLEVCPECGASKNSWEVRTCRFINGRWEYR